MAQRHGRAPLGRVVFLGDRFIEGDAHVSLLDRGYLLGEGAFATLRAYGGRCFRAERHLAQLSRAADAFGLPLRTDALERVRECARRVGEARVRVTLSDTAFSIIAEPITPPSEADYATGVDVVTVRARRVPPECFDGAIKSLSYAPSLLAQREARARGAFEGVQLALDGSLACGAVSNLFVVRGDELATPALDSGCRPGITREAVLELAPSLGLRPVERRIVADERFDEAFLTNSRIEVLPIATLDERPLPSIARARALHRAFRELVEREVT
jgi:branched-chain amino acid aminotransferase